jgi:hypothetical protein
MTTRNVYATLSEFKNYWLDRGGDSSISPRDDGVIEDLLEAASRLLDSKTGRYFYPRVEARVYDEPEGRTININADLQAVISFTNGDGVAISASEYNLLPRNNTPKYALQLKQNSTIIWEPDSNGDYEGVIMLTGIYAYHPFYSEAWKTGGTLAAAISDTTTASFTMTAGHTITEGKIVKIDSELFNVSAVSTANVITVNQRGDNGSTAATHLNGATVTIWQPMEEAHNAACEIANTAYRRRFGQSTSNTETVTAAGIVLSPREIPAMAQEFIKTYQRRTYS